MSFPFAQLLANGLIAGSMYALVSSGFSLIYAGNRFVHFAHGSVVAIGGYLTFTLFASLGLPFVLAAILSILLTGAIGVLCFRLLYTPLRNRKSSAAVLLIASLGLMILLDNILLMIYGAQVRTFDVIGVQSGISIFGALVTPLQLTIIGLTIVLLIGLQVFVKRTSLGKKMLAVADNPELAKISGINALKIQTIGFFLGSALAGIAGILIGLEQNLEPSMGVQLIVKGFTGAVIGGVGSVPGAVLGSYVLGIAENIGVWFVPSGYKDAIAFTILLAFLLLRPQGILGIDKGVRQ